MSYTHTVVGLFDSDFDAQDAVDELMRHRVARKDIDVNNRLDVHDPSFEDEHERYHHDPVKYKEHEKGFAAFFENLFGKGDEEAESYTKVALEGCTVVTVYTRSEAEATRVADILDNKGAIDMNERASKYGHLPNTQTAGNRSSKSRILTWSGEEALQIREHRSNEPKFW